MKKGNKKIITRILKIISLLLVVILFCCVFTAEIKTELPNMLLLPSPTPERFPEKEADYLVLKDRLETVLSKKNYGDRVNEDLIAVLLEAYTNYNYYERIFKIVEMPSVTEYLTVNFIDLLDEHIDVIRWGISHEELSDILGYDSSDIGGTYIEENRAIYTIRFSSYGTVFHEIYHSSQQNMYDGEAGDYIGFSKWFFNYVFQEGGAQKSNDLIDINYNGSSNYIPCAVANPEDIHYQFLISRRGASYEYTFLNGVYEKIRLMAGYQATEQYKLDGDIKKLINVVDGKYGEGTLESLLYHAENIYNIIEEFSEEYILNAFLPPYTQEDFENIVSNAVSMENIALNCLKSIIEKASTKQEVIDFLNYYRNYKLMYSIQYIQTKYIPFKDHIYENKSPHSETDHTYDLTNMFDIVESILIDKIVECKALPSLRVDHIKELMTETVFSRYSPYPLKLF